MRGALVAMAVLAACACAPTSGTAASTSGTAVSETVKLETSFTPDRLGASTTIGFGFQIAGPHGEAPPPLTHVDLQLPAGIDYVTTTMGLAVCQPAVLLAQGPPGCSPNSRIGSGSATVEVPFGTGGGQELPSIEAFMGPSDNGNLVVVFYADGRTPVAADVIFEGELVPGFGSSSGSLNNAIPLIPSVPGGSDVSIISVHTTIGPGNLRYYKRVHGKRVSFAPKGVSLPATCPRGGFPFTADFSFLDGTSATATSTVPCPPRRRIRSRASTAPTWRATAHAFAHKTPRSPPSQMQLPPPP